MFKSHIHQKRKPRQPLPERIARANTRRSKIRAHVEHVFAGQKHRMGLVVRTIGIARAQQSQTAPDRSNVAPPAALLLGKPIESTIITPVYAHPRTGLLMLDNGNFVNIIH